MTNVKVPENQFFVIAQMVADGATYADIGRHYDLSRERIRQIAKESMWLMDEYIQDLVHWLEEGGCTVESTRTENILNVNGFRCRVFVNPHKGTVEKKLDEPINIIIYKDDCYIIPVRSLPHNAKKIDLTFNALPSYLKYKNSLGMLDPWG
jgi:hypothetical protein